MTTGTLFFVEKTKKTFQIPAKLTSELYCKKKSDQSANRSVIAYNR